MSIERYIDEAARIGFDAVESLHIQVEREDNSYLQRSKWQAFVNERSLFGLSTHQGFHSTDDRARQKNSDDTIHTFELAYALGMPTIRINTGRWGTSKDFDECTSEN